MKTESKRITRRKQYREHWETKEVQFKKKDGSTVSFNKKVRPKKFNFPKDPKKGEQVTIVNHNKRITFEATGKKYPKWTIIKNEQLN